MRLEFTVVSLLILSIQGIATYFYHPLVWSFLITAPLFLLGVYEMLQKKRTIMKNYPLFGRLRYIMEDLRPKIYQYFIESDTDGTPISRIYRSLVYQRSKKQISTTPFGTQLDVYEPGYEWINHSMNPLPLDQVSPDNLRITVGGPDCAKPYSLSILNISAMSYGSLSSHAIEALNWGAKLGNFAHNTGEGSASDFHLKREGDLIWQIGTGYFGCRNEDGSFNAQMFAERSNSSNIKMIEIKLSQGAKPGHGGILPAKKNTPLIAKARGVTPHTTVASPSSHSAFSDPKGLLKFVATLRELSGGKPIGFKLCFGSPAEFEELCKTMVDTGITPDFITIDGGEGGTGAAPPEFSNSIGMSLRDGLIFASDLLKAYDLKKDIKILCSGKILTGFDIVKAISLGADACYSARGMMLALGCIQALECNTNKCPTGVATQNPKLYKGLDVEDKYVRVANFHHETVHAVAEILAAAGIDSLSKLNRGSIWRRVSPTIIRNYAELFPDKNIGSALITKASNVS
ncbi:MAG: FMN-binding glutamate synthase family protein [Halobacteriovorax sp.]|nr:FMN-binding glutamate synthase family protein [Halobacteriovorax sp.]|tara:strand:+ start:172996 stop:174543 length:1548 start_codon:yes stop_codon:yes gene_type:complete